MAFRWIENDKREEDVNPRGLDVNVRSGPQMREYAAIADRVASDRPGRVLDWGCGWGQMTELLMARGLEVEAFDVDPDLDTPARRPLEFYPHLSALITPELRRLPYHDASFDAALSCGVLEHVIDPGASLDELRRVLKPGGTLYVYKLPNPPLLPREGRASGRPLLPRQARARSALHPAGRSGAAGDARLRARASSDGRTCSRSACRGAWPRGPRCASGSSTRR